MKKDSAALVAPGGFRRPKRRFCGAMQSYTAIAAEQAGFFMRSLRLRESFPMPLLAPSAASRQDVHCETDAHRRSTRNSSKRLDRAAVLGCPPLHAPRESELSRGSRSGVHRESERCSRNSFMTPIPNRTAPNHALQRTAPRVTVAAISSSDPSRPSGALSYVRCLLLRSTTQLPRRAPQSLSLGSLGVLSPLP